MTSRGLRWAACGLACVLGVACRSKSMSPDHDPPTMNTATHSFVNRIDSLGGTMPVQSEGSLTSGERFYFRARHEFWSFRVARTAAAIQEPVWEWQEPYGDHPGAAGEMDHDTARAIIESCAEMRAKGVAAPIDRQGMAEDERRARFLARVITRDLDLYHGDALRDGQSLDKPIEEARAHYRSRTDPEWHALFEAELTILRERVRSGKETHDPWIFDQASARAVGRRWNAMVKRLPQAAHPVAIEQGKRWLTAWTTDGVREQALSEFSVAR